MTLAIYNDWLARSQLNLIYYIQAEGKARFSYVIKIINIGDFSDP